MPMLVRLLTVYGTGLATYDSGWFLYYYDDFVQYRTGRIKLHHWYRYDTAIILPVVITWCVV